MRRFRRLRAGEQIRSLVRETRIDKGDLIYPIFIAEGENIKKPVDSMPNVYQYSLDRADEILKEIENSGIAGLLIFGIPKHKDELATSAYDDNGVTQNAIRYIKKNYPSLLIIADVCLCEYTSHGHCGVVCGHEILNDETLPLLSKMAVSLAKAGADIIAPSDMMDGRVSAIRNALDENRLINTPIMSYSAKFASGYYSPFRDAAESAPEFGDRKSYQMDYANGKEALREIADDIDEGADMVMVKPALAYLDIVKAASERFDLPLVAYNVSGEYAMVKAAAEKGWIDEKKIVCENMIAIKRAGADIIITYHALDVAKWIDEFYKYLADNLPVSPWYYPEDQISDMPLKLLAAEIVREKLFLFLRQELPYALTVEPELWERREDGTVRAEITIYVERDSQKIIVLGKGGAMIKRIGQAARREIEELLEERIHLFLFVKVRENWGDDPARYADWGLNFNA